MLFADDDRRLDSHPAILELGRRICWVGFSSMTAGSGIDTKGCDNLDLTGVTGDVACATTGSDCSAGSIVVETEISGRENAEPISVSVVERARICISGATADIWSFAGLRGRAASARRSSMMVFNSKISWSRTALSAEFFWLERFRVNRALSADGRDSAGELEALLSSAGRRIDRIELDEDWAERTGRAGGGVVTGSITIEPGSVVAALEGDGRMLELSC